MSITVNKEYISPLYNISETIQTRQGSPQIFHSIYTREYRWYQSAHGYSLGLKISLQVNANK